MPAYHPKQWTCPVQTSQFENCFPLQRKGSKHKCQEWNRGNGFILRSQIDKWQKTSKIFFAQKKGFFHQTELNLNWKWKLNSLDAGASGQEWIGRMSLKEWISRLTAMDHSGNGWWGGSSLNIWQWLNISILSSIYPDHFNATKNKHCRETASRYDCASYIQYKIGTQRSMRPKSWEMRECYWKTLGWNIF